MFVAEVDCVGCFMVGCLDNDNNRKNAQQETEARQLFDLGFTPVGR